MKRLLSYFEENQQAREHLEQAQERFREKNFYEQYHTFHRAAKQARRALPVISIGTGITALALLFKLFIPWMWACFFLAAFALFYWEYWKSLVLTGGFEGFYQREKGLVFLLLLACLFTTGSAYFSVNGTRQLAQLLDGTETHIEAQFSPTLDSLHSAYDALIAQAKAEKLAYFRSNNYKGTITYTRDGSIAKHYQKLSDRVLELEKEKGNTLAEAHRKKEAALLEASQNHRITVWAALLLVGIVEGLIVLANWFVVYFDYRVQGQHTLLKAQLGKRIPVDPDGFRDFFQRVLLPYMYDSPLPKELLAQGTPPIGFKQPNQEDTRIGTTEKGDSPREIDEIGTKVPTHTPDWEGAIEAIRNGIKDRRYLMKQFRLSVNHANDLVERYGGEWQEKVINQET